MMEEKKKAVIPHLSCSLFCSLICRAMFMSGLSESKQTHVHLKNVDATTLQIIITYAYTGNLAISDSTVEPLYETACFLQVCSPFP